MDSKMIKLQLVDYVYKNPPKKCVIHKKDDMHLRIEHEDASGEINFYDLGHAMVTELIINKKATDENCFYLHFELNDLPHACELFHEMSLCFFGYFRKPHCRSAFLLYKRADDHVFCE